MMTATTHEPEVAADPLAARRGLAAQLDNMTKRGRINLAKLLKNVDAARDGASAKRAELDAAMVAWSHADHAFSSANASLDRAVAAVARRLRASAPAAVGAARERVRELQRDVTSGRHRSRPGWAAAVGRSCLVAAAALDEIEVEVLPDDVLARRLADLVTRAEAGTLAPDPHPEPDPALKALADALTAGLDGAADDRRRRFDGLREEVYDHYRAGTRGAALAAALADIRRRAGKDLVRDQAAGFANGGSGRQP